MRTVKHQLKPFTIEQKNKFLDVVCAYQFEKNYFSDQLLNRLHENEVINIQSSYIQIRDKLVKNNYQSKYNLPSRLWKMALKEAYDLHIRTHEAQIALIKRNFNNNIYQYCNFELTEKNHNNQDKTNLSTIQSLENFKVFESFEACKTFEAFLYFATNSLFYNFKTFCRFEAEYFSKQFKKARIYQRAKTILLDLLKRGKVVEKEVLTKEEAKQLKQLLESNSDTLFNRLFEHYCHSLVKAIQKFRSFKSIQSQINPTITLDGDCYDLYSKYDDEAKKNRWFLDIMSMKSGKRIKNLELTGFHYAKQIMKHRKAANLTISFDPNQLGNDNCIYAHFTFPDKQSRNKKKTTKKSSKQKHKTNKNKIRSQKAEGEAQLETLTTIGGDFGLTECFTFSDGWVAGSNQGEMLRKITEYTTKSIKNIQKHSKNGYFGVEKNNIVGKRNHQKNCFNHNSELNNVNRHYNKQQEKYNRRLENYKHQFMNEIIDHFTTDNIYGQYASLLKIQPIQLVFEDLDFVNLGRSKEQKRQINLIKEVLTLLEEKIVAKPHNLPIEIIYVNPAYTSQTCPNCGFVAKKNRDYQTEQFRCQHCSFTANDDVRYRMISKFVQSIKSNGAATATPTATLPAADDYIASQNIAMRPSILRNSKRLRIRKIKDLLLARHEQIKGSCKMFASEH